MSTGEHVTTLLSRTLDRARRHGQLIALASVWVAAIVLLLVWGQADVFAARSRAPDAEVDHTEDFRAPTATAETVPAQLAPRSDLEMLATVPFNRSLVVQRRIIEYTATYPEAATAEATTADQDAAAADQDTTDEATSPTPVQRLAPGDELETNVGQFIERSATRELDERWISAVATVEQRHPGGLERTEGIGLPTRAVQREDQLLVEALPQPGRKARLGHGHRV